MNYGDFEKAEAYEHFVTEGTLVTINGRYEYFEPGTIILIQQPKKQKLTFERIRKECTPMEHLLVDENGEKRIFIGFTRDGRLVTDDEEGFWATCWAREDVEKWTIEEYKE